MVDPFQYREQAFENQWAHDEELRFRVLARRDKLLGLWAAGEMGLSAGPAEAYAQTIVQAELAKNGDEAVFEKIKSDLAKARIARTDYLIHRKMEEFFNRAHRDVMDGK